LLAGAPFPFPAETLLTVVLLLMLSPNRLACGLMMLYDRMFT